LFSTLVLPLYFYLNPHCCLSPGNAGAADGKMAATMATRASSASLGSIAWHQPDNGKCTRGKCVLEFSGTFQHNTPVPQKPRIFSSWDFHKVAVAANAIKSQQKRQQQQWQQ